jgi:hypothetical protein
MLSSGPTYTDADGAYLLQKKFFSRQKSLAAKESIAGGASPCA